jgi:S-adenosylmethionine-dependent methyltransferase
MDRWRAEEHMPWGRLRRTMTQANLRRHIGATPLRILDAGGGNGLDSIPLAAAGHHVTIVDYSAAMLAEAARNATAAQAQERVMTRQAELLALPELFAQPCFDLVLCHNVLQYVDDVPALLSTVATPLHAGGLLSIMSVNRYAIPYRAAFFRDDLAEAYEKIDARNEPAVLFGTRMNEYAAEEIAAMLPAAGFVAIQDYGIRCMCDYWGDNERKSDPTIFAQLEQLELALSDRHPYKLLARYFQLVARKESDTRPMRRTKRSRASFSRPSTGTTARR